MSFPAGVAVVVGVVREFRALFDLFWCCSRCSGRCSEVVRVERGVVRVSLVLTDFGETIGPLDRETYGNHQYLLR